ncbi:MAG: discoidin domain-containing protein [Kiritimatiellaeota bacterium]|nr:discoidin domain-containing protein [Kiritimatiellota bacterium]
MKRKRGMIRKAGIVLGIAVWLGVTPGLNLMGSPYPPPPDEQRDPHPYYKPWPPILLPEGCSTLLSRGCKVTAKDPAQRILGDLKLITDGNKEIDAYVELMPGPQWIQIDLGEEKEVHAICLWHYHDDMRVCHDVVVQISNDEAFVDGVVTVFNNDHDNSSGLGKGEDKEYVEGRYGRPFAVDAVKGRYVRCHSNGYTFGLGRSRGGMSRYTEVEVFGWHLNQAGTGDKAQDWGQPPRERRALVIQYPTTGWHVHE